jgi:hypothetical protein
MTALISPSRGRLVDLSAPAAETAELRLDTVSFSAEDNARNILDHLKRAGFVRDTEGD